MARPLSISRTDIEHWADRYDASGTLPVLMRRLLLATTPLASIEMRGDSGTRLGGWDGEVLSRGETPWCPSGMSVWEVSVRDDVKQKLDEDFDKRTKAPELSVDPRRVTYIAVTARSFDKKKSWAKEKKAKGAWADVRVYDADDLATWLEQAPVVRMWFGSTELGRLTHESRTIEDFLHEFSQASMPPLPPSILLSGDKRTQQARELLQALVKTDEALRRMSKQRPLPMRTWRIGAESAEEALLFVAATLSMPGDEAASLRERTLIVETQEAFRYYLHAQTLEPLVLLPKFANALPGKTVGPRVQAVLPVSWKDEIGAGEGLKLDLIPYAPLERALAAAGFADPGRLARDADGRWSKLRVLLMGTTRGQRMSDISPEQIALLLVGAWKPTQEADRAVMRQLGADPDKAERLSAALTQEDDPMLEAPEDEREGLIYRVAAPRTAWKKLGKNVTESDLNRFFQVTQEVLAPVSAPPVGEDWTAPRTRIESEVGFPSGALRTGIAASITWLAVADEEGYLEPTHRRGRGSELAAVLVSRLLSPDWYAWWSHSAIVRDLAEAAPSEFFACLFASLKQSAEGVAALLSGRTERMIPDGFAWHAGHGGSNQLLWALETLAWSAEWIPQVVLALAELDAHDKLPERHSNRPFRSLREILHPLLPQSKTTAAQRSELLALMFERHGEVAWRLTITLVNELRGGGMLIQTPRPQYRRWVDTGEQPRVTHGDIAKQIDAMLGMLLSHAAENPTRWAALVDLPHESIGWRVVDALQDAYPRLVQKDDDAVLWDAVRIRLIRASWGVEQQKKAPNEWSEKLHEEQRRFRDLYHAHTPSDFVLRYRWLFDGNDDLPEPVPGGSKANIDEKENLRRGAIEEFGKLPDRWAVLGRLASNVKQPQILSHALATCSYVEDIESALLQEPPTLDLGASLASFWAWRRETQGSDWFERLLRTLVERERVNDAANVLLLFRGTEQIWDLVDRIGNPLRETYWKKHEPLWFDSLSASGYARGIEYLLEFDRVDAAVKAAQTAVHYERIDASLVLRVLRGLGDADARERVKGIDQHRVEELFGELDKHSDIGEDEIIELEIALADRLDSRQYAGYATRGARRFYQKLARSPEYFVEVMRRMRRPDGVDVWQEWSSRPTDAAGIERKHLRTLVHQWPGYPGEDLPIAERETILDAWCSDVERLASDIAGVDQLLEYLLARVDVAEDGHWPCLAARRLIENGQMEHLPTAVSNGRGLQLRGLGEGEKPLRALADEYEAGANALRGKYPKTAAMLDAMARGRVREAVQVETEERREHIEWGEQERGDAEAPKKQAPSTSLRPNALPDSPLTRLEVRHVGPAPEFVLDLAPRLNLFTGDNSLGKTFILDVLWWTLTGSWVGHPAKPEPKRTKNGKIAKSKAAIIAQSGSHTLTGTYNALHERWSTQNDGPLAPGLVIYAHVNGGFSIWDPIRNVTPIAKDELDLSSGYHFSPQELWEGKTSDDKTTVLCKGLREDLVDWPRDQEQRETMQLLNKVLQRISPPGEGIEIGDAARFKVRDARDVPRLKLPYGLVFAEHASAAVKRMLSLAYALVWSVTEVRRAAPMAELDPLQNITFLIDEIEAHLHPKWQRTILRALLELANDIAPMAKAQLVVTTHAPLVLVSIQNIVDDKQDALFDFDLETIEDGPNQTRKVSVIEREPWELHGDVNAWLGSEIFNETHVLSKEQEDAIDNASRLLEEPTPDKKRGREAFDELVKTLGPAHPQLLRFRYLAEKKGWLS